MQQRCLKSVGLRITLGKRCKPHLCSADENVRGVKGNFLVSMRDLKRHQRKDRPIRHVLRHKLSGQYFTGSGWTDDFEAARNFRNSLEAVQTCLHHGLTRVEIVLRLEGGTCELFCTEIL